MIRRLLIKLIKRNKNMEALMEEQDVREKFLNSLTQEEKARVLEKLNYSNIVVNADIEGKKINLSNSILVNVNIHDCKIDNGIINNVIYKSTIQNNIATPGKINKEKIDLIPIK